MKKLFFPFHRRFLDVVKGTAKVKISNRKDSGREDAASEDTNCPDESTSGSGVASSFLTHPAAGTGAAPNLQALQNSEVEHGFGPQLLVTAQNQSTLVHSLSDQSGNR